MAKFRRIEGMFRRNCLRWGYNEIRTPALEYLHLFTSVGTLTPNMLNRVYSFLDWDGWSGERVVLRPEGTIPVARLYIENLSEFKPAKLFYVENMFSFEETGTRSRERWQCGAEIIGSAKTLADIEIIMLAITTLRDLGFDDVELHLSHAGLIRAVLDGLGLTPDDRARTFDRLLDGDEVVVEDLIKGNPKLSEALSLLFRSRGKSVGFLQNLQATLSKVLPDPHLKTSMANFIDIAERLTELGCPYEIDTASGKGFEYYTGIIFRLHRGDQKVGGGGRYNDLIPLLGGGDTAASGFALQIDRLMDLVQPGQEKEQSVLVQCNIATPRGERYCFELADEVRRAGYIAELDQGGTDITLYRWLLAVEGEDGKPEYVLTDRITGHAVRTRAVQDVVDKLQGERASETGAP